MKVLFAFLLLLSLKAYSQLGLRCDEWEIGASHLTVLGNTHHYCVWLGSGMVASYSSYKVDSLSNALKKFHLVITAGTNTNEYEINDKKFW